MSLDAAIKSSSNVICNSDPFSSSDPFYSSDANFAAGSHHERDGHVPTHPYSMVHERDLLVTMATCLHTHIAWFTFDSESNI